MQIVVTHHIADPVAFFERSPSDPERTPAGMEPHGFYPSADGYEAVCLWEADSIDALESVLEPAFEDVSEQEYFAIDENIAFYPPEDGEE